MFGKMIKSIVSMFKPAHGSMSAKEAQPAVKNKTHFLLDVRSPGEFAGGKIEGAKNIPLDQLSARIGELEKYKEKPILVNCLSGMRSGSACRILTSQGFSDVTNLSGGVSAWQAAGMKLL